LVVVTENQKLIASAGQGIIFSDAFQHLNQEVSKRIEQQMKTAHNFCK